MLRLDLMAAEAAVVQELMVKVLVVLLEHPLVELVKEDLEEVMDLEMVADLEILVVLNMVEVEVLEPHKILSVHHFMEVVEVAVLVL